jgi:1-acyl-sn-glycerol-3-phosphate acyltransferase
MKIVKWPPFIVAMSYWFWRNVSRFIGWQRYRLKTTGQENVPRTGPLILAANHISWLDPPLVGAWFPRRITYMAKKELFEIKWLGPLIETLGAFPVDREGSARAAIKHSLEVLKAGGCVGIFPEGGRNVDGDKEAQTGVALLAALSGAPVIPAAIVGSELSRGKDRPPATVVYGKPIQLPANAKTKREDLAAFTDQIMAAITAARDSVK